MILRVFLAIASIYGLTAVAFGAFGAHALREKLDPSQLATWQTAVTYQFVHALALMLTAVLSLHIPARFSAAAGACFAGGVLLFSGSLYLLAARELLGLGSFARVLGPITPLGGLTLMAGWLLMLVGAISRGQ